MLLNSLVTQSTYCVILCLPCAILKSFLRREKTFAQRKIYVILKIIPSAIYIRNLVEFYIMAHGKKIHRFWRVKTKSSFFSKIKTCLRKKKMYNLSCLTKVYLCAKIESIWIFDPCHKNYIFVWFLQGCLPKCDSVILFCKVLSTGSFFPSNVTVTNRQLLKKSTSWSRK